MANGNSNGNGLITSRNMKLLVLFILSYLVLFFLANWSQMSSSQDITGLRHWNFSSNIFTWDYSLFFLPIAGFFFMYLAIDWIESFFETKFLRSIFFPVFVIVISFVAFFVAVFWLDCNLISLNTDPGTKSICTQKGADTTMQILLQLQEQHNILLKTVVSILPSTGPWLSSTFTNEYLQSPYFVFVLGALFGWGSKLILDRMEEQ